MIIILKDNIYMVKNEAINVYVENGKDERSSDYGVTLSLQEWDEIALFDNITKSKAYNKFNDILKKCIEANKTGLLDLRGI